ncbi:hypothetical protein SH1V18_10640 [Vallitalea longa]|uniref:Uncharacterized protein n=1 Tax=Vallitalea longa TaxID=2936439 RepID=A0A9W5YAW1_9FIRM|nr:hypothetical protein SH1V18_10640 [Vallitalea longa]
MLFHKISEVVLRKIGKLYDKETNQLYKRNYAG